MEVVGPSGLRLRALAEGDRAEMARVLERSAVFHAPWMPSRPADEPWEAVFDRAWLAARAGLAWKGVAVDPDGALVGFFNLNNLAWGPFRNAYAGWAVSVDARGRGVATEGVGLLLKVAFAPPPDGLGLHRVQANIVPRNAASLRVAEKNGFRREGLAIRYLEIAGRWEDHVLLAKLADEP